MNALRPNKEPRLIAKKNKSWKMQHEKSYILRKLNTWFMIIS